MSVALPSGYVSVPSEQNVSVSASGQVRVRCLTGVSASPFPGWSLVGAAFSGGARTVTIIDPDGISHLVESFTDPSFPAPWSQWYDFSVAWTGYRKGRVLELLATAGTPAFGQKDVQETESWFTDAGSQIVSSLGAFTHTQTFSDPPASAGPVIGVLEWHSISTVPFPGQYPLVQWQGISLTDWDSGTLTQLDDGMVRGSGSGKAELYAGFGNNARFLAPAYEGNYDIIIDQNGTPAPDWARFTDQWFCKGVGALPYITAPASNGGFTAQNVNWPLTTPYHQGFGQFSPGSLGTGIYLSFELQSAWMAAQDPALEEADRFVGIRGLCGLDAPSSPSNYQPVKLKVLTSVDIHRPDGNKPSSWITLDGTLGTVADGATNVVFTVTGAGASFARTLSSAWRARADYRDVLHHTAEDVFWVAVYGWLKLTINASAGGTVNLTARGVHYDTQTSSETAFTFIYPFAVAAGTHDYFIDLLAGSGSAAYPTRVDEWLLDFEVTGTFTLSAMALVARTDLLDGVSGKAYTKTLPTKPTANTDYNMLVVSLDGAQSMGLLPPYPAAKGHELDADEFGGSPRHIVSDMLTLKDAWTKDGPEYGLGKCEGIADPVYTLATYEGKNKDGYGNALGPENADWLEIVAPHVLVAAGTDWQPYVSPLVARIRITNRSSYTAKVRWSLWGALEALVMQGGGRAPAGAALNAIRTDTGGVVASGTTDAQGMLVITPVPFNSTRDYRIDQA